MPARAMAILLAVLIAGPATSWAQGTDAEDLNKKLSNPISDLVSVPLQFNWEFGEGPDQDMWQITNLQPVVPFAITDRTYMIARLIMPSVSTPGNSFDGDMTFSLFFSPARSTGLIWGAGPAMLIPRTGEKWGIGPTVVVLKQEGKLTYGALANHIWSFAGDGDREHVNATLLQPFLNYTTKTATTFYLNTESTYDWNGEQWTVPINVGVAQLMKIGKQPIQIGGGPRWYADAPDGGPDWGFRLNLVFLFPRFR